MQFIARQIAGLLAGLVLLTTIPVKSHADVTVFAAASLKTVLEAAVSGYSEPVVLSFGGSGTIARQVAAGAPADLVILANEPWMDWLATRGAVTGDPVILAQNKLVLIGPADAAPLEPAGFVAALGGDGRLALGDTRAVPAGIYAKEALQSLGVWTELSTRLAPTDNVRHALAFVARGEAPLGIVYASDAKAEPRVSILYEFDAALHSPIRYPAGLVEGGNQRAAQNLLSHLQSRSYLFEAAGFMPAGGA